jgi:hypothetical protein
MIANLPQNLVERIDDDESASVIGRSAGVGGGVFFTSAATPEEPATPEELRGPFHTTQVNTPMVSVQYDVSGPLWVLSITFGPNLGASYWSGKTSTITTPGLLYVPK